VNILAIDTSSPACVLGLQLGGERYTDVRQSERSHSRDILPAIESLLAKADTTLAQLDCIVFGQGPGSFTGLRIAVGVVQGLAFGLEIPVVPVSSLACLAQAQYRNHNIRRSVVVLHARKEEVYLGVYEVTEDIVRLVGKESVTDVSDITQVLSGDWSGVGDGWILREQMEMKFGIAMQSIITDVFPDPEALLDLGVNGYKQGHTVSAIDARPEYLREVVATASHKG
jgi:tRNA threonylcarbamoyladenosine biosynthesis protein TsaB